MCPLYPWCGTPCLLVNEASVSRVCVPSGRGSIGHSAKFEAWEMAWKANVGPSGHDMT